jgi:DNA mismatch repair ATPase MutS
LFFKKNIELTCILEDYFKNYYFQENITEDVILFDYKIYYGKSTTQNAIKLLSILGYGDNIVEGAGKKTASFLKNGI